MKNILILWKVSLTFQSMILTNGHIFSTKENKSNKSNFKNCPPTPIIGYQKAFHATCLFWNWG